MISRKNFEKTHFVISLFYIYIMIILTIERSFQEDSDG